MTAADEYQGGTAMHPQNEQDQAPDTYRCETCGWTFHPYPREGRRVVELIVSAHLRAHGEVTP